MIDINDPKVRLINSVTLKKHMSFYDAMRLARKHYITIEFHPKSVCATKHRHSSVVKYAHCKSEDAAAILAVENCLEEFNRLTRKH